MLSNRLPVQRGMHESGFAQATCQPSPRLTLAEDNSEVPATSTPRNIRTRNTSISSNATHLATSPKIRKKARLSKKAPLKKLSRPKMRNEAAKSPHNLAPAASRNRVASEPEHELMEGQAAITPKPRKHIGTKDTILTRLVKWQKKARTEQSNKPYKDLQKEGKNGVGALYSMVDKLPRKG